MMSSVRALIRFRWLLSALGVPVCVAAVGVGVQGVAFRRPTGDTLVAAAALEELLRYHVMRGTEELGRTRVTSTCVQGWFRPPHGHRLVRGELVLLGNGTRLYDVGHGIRVAGTAGLAPLADRARFLLAACPRFLGEVLGERLIKGARVHGDRTAADGGPALLLAFRAPRGPMALYVSPPSDRPVELRISGAHGRGWTDLNPGGGRAAIRRVFHAFRVATKRRTLNA